MTDDAATPKIVFKDAKTGAVRAETGVRWNESTSSWVFEKPVTIPADHFNVEVPSRPPQHLQFLQSATFSEARLVSGDGEELFQIKVATTRTG